MSSRRILLALCLSAAALAAGPAVCAGEPAAAAGPRLTWPGKVEAAAPDPAPEAASAATPASPPAAGALALSKGFFGPADDLARAPAPLAPRAFAGAQTTASAAETPSNRARQIDLLTNDSASDGPAGGAGQPD